MTDIITLLQIISPRELLAAVTVLVALSIVLYAFTEGRMAWITFGFAGGATSVILRPVNEIVQADLGLPILFLGGIVASTGYFMSAYRSWQEIRQTEERDEAERVTL